jgi:hypothetical protein
LHAVGAVREVGLGERKRLLSSFACRLILGDTVVVLVFSAHLCLLEASPGVDRFFHIFSLFNLGQTTTHLIIVDDIKSTVQFFFDAFV